MAHSTTDWGLPVPDDSDPLNSLGQAIRDLADAIETKVDGLIPSSSDFWNDTVANWSLTDHQCILKVGSMFWFDMLLLRDAGGTITTGANGNLAPDESIGTLRPGWRPSRTQFVRAHKTGSAGTATWSCRISTDGTVELTDGQTGSTLAVGDSIRVLGLACIL